MRRLFQKMLRDFWDFKAQFCSVFVMSLLAVLIYTGIEGVWLGMQNQGNAWFEKSRLADVWISGDEITDSDIDRIKEIDNVSSVQAAAIEDATVKLKDSKDAEIRLIYNKTNQISIPDTVSGSKYNTNESGCWIDKEFATANHISVGDTLKISNNSKEKTVSVKGIILSPDYIFYTGPNSSLFAPNHAQNGYAYVSSDIFKSLSDNEDDILYNQVKIKTSKKADIFKLRDDVEDKLGSKYIGFFDRSNWSGVYNYTNKISQMKKMSIMFSILFFFLTLLTMQTTMKRVVETERTQIGTFKALGFRNGQLYFMYACYGLVISLLGSAVGLILAPHVISPTLLNLQKKFYTMPHWEVKNSWAAFGAALLIVIWCVVSSAFASRKGIKGMPAEAMREAAPKSGKEIALERIPLIWNLISFEWKWTLRDISRNKIRTATGIVAILGSMVLLIASFGLNDSLVKANHYVYGTQYDYASKITLSSNAGQKDRETLYSKLNSDGQWVEECAIEIQTSKDKQKNAVLSVLGPGIYVHLKNQANDDVALPDDKLLVSRRLAQDMNIKKGDYIKFRVLGYPTPFTANVADIVTTPTPQGIYMSDEAWENLCAKSLSASVSKLNAASKNTSNSAEKLESASQNLVTGSKNLSEQLATVSDSVKKLNQGLSVGTDSIKTLSNHLSSLDDSVASLSDGLVKLQSGYSEIGNNIGKVNSSLRDLSSQLNTSFSNDQYDKLQMSVKNMEMLQQAIGNYNVTTKNGEQHKLSETPEYKQWNLLSRNLGNSSLAMGLTIMQLKSGVSTLSNNLSKINSAEKKANESLAQLVSAVKKMKGGTAQLKAGCQELAQKYSEASSSQSKLANAMQKISDGSKELYDGQSEFNSALKNTTKQISALSSLGTIQNPSGIDKSSFFKPTALLTGKSNLDDIKNEAYVKDIITLDQQLNDADEILNSVKMIILLLLSAAILLTVVILYNLGILNYTERRREYAAMKVLGFHQKEIRAVIFKDTIFNIVIGWLLGIPAGLLFLKAYVGAVTTDTFEYTPIISSTKLLLSTCIAVGTSIIVGVLVSRKVKKLDMVESLKSGE